MRVGKRGHDEQGLATALVDSAGLHELAAALDPAVAFVVLMQHTPTKGWTEARVPIGPGDLVDPALRTVRNLSFDVLMTTAEFLDLVPHLDAIGASLYQVSKRPNDDARFDDPRPGPRAAKLRSLGLSIAIELPHPHESAQFTALNDDALDAAIGRLAGSN